MKVERKTEGYEPIVITLETEEEAAAMRALFNWKNNIIEHLAEVDDELNTRKLEGVFVRMDIHGKLTEAGITREVQNKHFESKPK